MPTADVEITAVTPEVTQAMTPSETAPVEAETTPAATPSETTAAAEESPSGKATLVGDEAQRIAAVVPAFHEYWDVINQTYADGGAAEATPDMERIMTSGQLDYWVNAFSNWKEKGHRYEGVNRVLYATSKLVSLEADGGVADVEFCVDMSGTRAFDAQDNPLHKDGLYQSGVAVLEWIDGGWKVAGYREGTANKDQC